MIDSSSKPDVEELEWKILESRRSGSAVQRLEYRTPKTISVPAAAPEPTLTQREMGLEAATKIAELQARVEASERGRGTAIEDARRSGYEQGSRDAEQRSSEALSEALKQIGSALSSFEAERELYFLRVEGEVVRLALAIAARVLYREAHLDPLLLAGAVRVALGRLSEGTRTCLRVPADQVPAWTSRLAGITGPVLEIVGDPALEPMQAMIETRLGSVELGVQAQLSEIESGLFDLMTHRPARRLDE